MSKNRFALSLIALIGSALLFVATSFAWFAVSNNVKNNGITDIEVQDIEVSAVLYVSSNGTDYTETTSIDFQNRVPGDTIYYKIIVTNSDKSDVQSKIILSGFTDAVADSNGSDANFLAGRSLTDVILINASNDVSTYSITDRYLSDEIMGDSLTLANDLALLKSEVGEVDFSFTLDPNVFGNDYQNLKLTIAHIYVQTVSQ